jgi:hypothetical protein
LARDNFSDVGGWNGVLAEGVPAEGNWVAHRTLCHMLEELLSGDRVAK